MPIMKGYVSTGMVGSKREFSFYIPSEQLDKMSEKEIEELALESMFDCIEWNFDIIEDADA